MMRSLSHCSASPFLPTPSGTRGAYRRNEAGARSVHRVSRRATASIAFIPDPNRAMVSRCRSSSPYGRYLTSRSATRLNTGRDSLRAHVGLPRVGRHQEQPVCCALLTT